jgi:hypothetical protein
MPCLSNEEECQHPESPAPVNTTKSLRNDGPEARLDNPDAEHSEGEYDDDGGEDEEPVTEKSVSLLNTCWLSNGLLASEQSCPKDIKRKLFEEAHKLMHLSALKKLLGHKGLDTDLHLCGRGPAQGIRHGRVCRTISIVCCISVSA